MASVAFTLVGALKGLSLCSTSTSSSLRGELPVAGSLSRGGGAGVGVVPMPARCLTIQMAHNKGAGSTKNGRDSRGQCFGVNIVGDHLAKPGAIIVRQRGTKEGRGSDVGMHYATKLQHKRKANKLRALAADGDTAADVASSSSSADGSAFPQLELQPLPYPLDALEPYMRRETVEYHWGTHQRSHVERLNGMIAGTHWEGMPLRKLMLSSFNTTMAQPHPPFFHAAQIWNHDFYWRSMKPGGGGKPSGALLELIVRDFGSFDAMIKQLTNVALSQFGSGWAWLSYKANRLNVGNAINPCPSENDNRLVVSKTPNAVNPLLWGYSPLLAIDVWEHAYYLDYENRKGDYVSTLLEKLVSWEMVSSRLDVAVERAAQRQRKSKSKKAMKKKYVNVMPRKTYRRGEMDIDREYNY